LATVHSKALLINETKKGCFCGPTCFRVEG